MAKRTSYLSSFSAVFNDAFFDADSSTPALLAVRRFVRGTLRQVSLGVMSLILILNVAGHTPVVDAFTASESPVNASLSALFPSERDSESVSKVSADVAVTRRPHRILSSKMTSHRLTSARLSLPPQVRSIVSIAEAQ